jgi:hypothetical protein
VEVFLQVFRQNGQLLAARDQQLHVFLRIFPILKKDLNGKLRKVTQFVELRIKNELPRLQINKYPNK